MGSKPIPSFILAIVLALALGATGACANDTASHKAATVRRAETPPPISGVPDTIQKAIAAGLPEWSVDDVRCLADALKEELPSLKDITDRQLLLRDLEEFCRESFSRLPSSPTDVEIAAEKLRLAASAYRRRDELSEAERKELSRQVDQITNAIDKQAQSLLEAARLEAGDPGRSAFCSRIEEWNDQVQRAACNRFMPVFKELLTEEELARILARLRENADRLASGKRPDEIRKGLCDSPESWISRLCRGLPKRNLSSARLKMLRRRRSSEREERSLSLQEEEARRLKQKEVEESARETHAREQGLR